MSGESARATQIAGRLAGIEQRFGEFYRIFFDSGDYCAEPLPGHGIGTPRRVLRESTAAGLTEELVTDLSLYTRSSAH